jgi:transposase InsO family protein
MRENGIKATVVGLYYYNPKRRDHYQRVENHLAVQDAPTCIGQQWVADFTYLKTRRGQWVYLATIMDLFSRKIIGWSLSKARNVDFTTSSLAMAIRQRTPLEGAIFHTDQGIEYAGDRFQEALRTAKLTPSMSGKGRCLDNATAESFFHTFKTESFYQRRFKDMQEIRKEFISYIDFYNNERLHSSLNYVSPNEFEQRAA